MAGDERPNKRQKPNHQSTSNGGGRGSGKWRGTANKRNPSRTKYRAQAASNLTTNRDGNRGSVISATGLQSGDVGIFVTSDKGCEKRALREVEDLLMEIIDGEGGEKGGKEGGEGGEGQAGVGGVGDEADVDGAADLEKGEEDGDGNEVKDIEKDILAELEEMRGGSETQEAARNGGERGDKTTRAIHGTSSSKLGLITLDIPCVSFVRLPPPSNTTNKSTGPSKDLDPVELVYRICRQAYRNPTRPRSRYIKRLTPITRVRKIMNEGIEKLCDETLPSVFGIEQGKSWKYAVRVTVRNNQQVSKEEIIKGVAGYVVRVGKGEGSEDGAEVEKDGGNTSSEDESADAVSLEEKTEEVEAVKPLLQVLLEHKVDLKHFDKLIVVEVYRNVVGMSVVGEAREFEDELKRLNLSEIYAEGRRKVEEGKKDGEGIEASV